MSKGRKMSARIPCTPEVHQALRDVANGAGITFDELLRIWIKEKGIKIDDRESIFRHGLEMKESLEPEL